MVGTIVVCADGTWNRPEEDLAKDHPTNVLKLARAVRPATGGRQQRVFYDWGLGSYHSQVLAGATGHGIHKNILDGYRYIVQNYAAGDRLYLFGFSRGAYTVRALCGLINNCGIVKRPDARLVERAFKIYKSPAAKYHPEGDGAVRFRREHSHRSRKVAFVGVWDTVGALGIPFSLMGLLDRHDEFYDTKLGRNVRIARHALAIDEQREDFEPTLWSPRTGMDIKQVWFAGVHSDIGGSYGPDKSTGAEVSDTALAWMLDEAVSAGLKIEPHLRERLTDGVLAPVHRSRRHVYRLKKPLHRPLLVPGRPTLIHPSVQRRWESDSGYRPRRLKQLVAKGGWGSLPVGC